MTDPKDEVLERNVERLVRASALPDAEDARARFLTAVASGGAPATSAKPGGGNLLAVAASFLAAAAVIWSMIPSDPPGESADTDFPKPLPSAAEMLPEAVGRDGDAKLSIGSSAWSPRSPWFDVKGEVPLPDRARVQVVIQRLEESHAGGALVARDGAANSAQVEVRKGKFSTRLSGDLGFYEIRVTPLEEIPKGPRWTAGVHVTSRTFMRRLDRELEDLIALSRQALQLVDTFETACEKQKTWEQGKARLVGTSGDLVRQMTLKDQRTLYPAAFREIFYSIRLMAGAADSFTWKDGKLEVRTYYGKQEPVKTHRGEEFNFDRFRQYIREAVPLAGREAVLWAVSERKRGRVVDGAFNSFLDRISNECEGETYVRRFREEGADLEALSSVARAGE